MVTFSPRVPAVIFGWRACWPLLSIYWEMNLESKPGRQESMLFFSLHWKRTEIDTIQSTAWPAGGKQDGWTKTTDPRT